VNLKRLLPFGKAQQENHPELKIPIVIVPATVSNIVPAFLEGAGFTLLLAVSLAFFRSFFIFFKPLLIYC
jgi:hypothetical protein